MSDVASYTTYTMYTPSQTDISLVLWNDSRNRTECPMKFHKILRTLSFISPSLHLCVSPLQKHKSGHIFQSIDGRAFTFGIHGPCENIFERVPYLDLWHTQGLICLILQKTMSSKMAFIFHKYGPFDKFSYLITLLYLASLYFRLTVSTPQQNPRLCSQQNSPNWNLRKSSHRNSWHWSRMKGTMLLWWGYIGRLLG